MFQWWGDCDVLCCWCTYKCGKSVDKAKFTPEIEWQVKRQAGHKDEGSIDMIVSSACGADWSVNIIFETKFMETSGPNNRLSKYTNDISMIEWLRSLVQLLLVKMRREIVKNLSIQSPKWRGWKRILNYKGVLWRQRNKVSSLKELSLEQNVWGL